MRCPFCGCEMRHGYLKSGVTILWSEERPKKVPLRVWRKKQEQVLAYNGFGGAAIEGFDCPGCHKIILLPSDSDMQKKGSLSH
jgi:hypothetical protein